MNLLKLNYAELITQKTISLPNKNLDYDDLNILCEVIEESADLEDLQLLSTRIVCLNDGKLEAAIAKNTTLKRLYLYHYHNSINLRGIEYLADALKVNNTLQELHLGGNDIGDEGAEYIADMLLVNKTLQQISLKNNGIGDDGAECLAIALKGNKSLQMLVLDTNNIGDEGAKYIAEMLSINKTLQVITLYNNTIGDQGAQSIANSLVLNTGIRKIDLISNKFGDQGAEKLADALESNHNIEYIDFCSKISNHILERIEAILNCPKRGDIPQSPLDKLELLIAKQKDKELKGRNIEIAKKDRDNESLKEGLADAQKKIAERDKDIAKKDKQLDQLESIKRILNPTGNEGEPPNKRTRTEDTLKTPKVKSVLMNSEHTDCSICCAKFSADLDSKVEDIRKHLPVLSSSKTCDHYFCHGCILKQQLELAQKNNGRFPNWIPCMICKTKTAFRPSEPKYHRLLIDILKKAKWVDAPKVKEEQVE